MSIKFTGGFHPNISFRSRSLVAPSAPLPQYNLPLFQDINGGLGVYHGNFGFSITNDGTTAIRSSMTGGARNAAITQSFLGGKFYFEWVVEQVSPNAYFGLGFIEDNQNQWSTNNCLNSINGMRSVVITRSGSLYRNGSLIQGGILGKPIVVGDVIGFAVDATAAGKNRVNIHLNGTWALGLTDQDIVAGTSFLLDSEEARYAWQPIIGSAASDITVGATLNGGQLRPVKQLDGYKMLGSPKQAVGLMPGYGVLANSDQKVTMSPGFGGFSYLSARATRTIDFNKSIYFEVTVENVKANSRFGFRSIRESDVSGFGASTNMEVAWQPTTGTAFFYNKTTTGAQALNSTVAVGGKATYGIALRTIANYTGKAVWIRSPSGWQRAMPLPGTTTNSLQTYGDGGPPNMFYIQERYAARGATWTINGGAQPFVYGAPNGFTPWDLS